MWKSLPRPFLVQAPMEDVTDTVFRQMLARTSAPDVFFTEFTNVDGLLSAGKKAVEHRLMFSRDEQKKAPIVAQIWGHKPENYYNGTKHVKRLGFDGVDINMGCPQKDIVRKGLCGALIDNEPLAASIIQATLDAAHEGSRKLDVSVKTRIGVKTIRTEQWVTFLLGFPLAALTLHGRTVKEMSRVPAHWEEIAKAVKIRDSLKHGAVIVGNGDIKNAREAHEHAQKHGVDGVMIGRGMFDTLFAFDLDQEKRNAQLSLSDRLKLLKDHVLLFQKTWGSQESATAGRFSTMDKPTQGDEAGTAGGLVSEGGDSTASEDENAQSFFKRFYSLRKYLKIYVKGFEGASDLRVRLMNADSAQEVCDILSAYGA